MYPSVYRRLTEQLVNFEDKKNLNVTSRSISEALFKDILDDLTNRPPLLTESSALEDLPLAEEELRLRLLRNGIDLERGENIEVVDDEAAPEAFDVDYTLAMLLDTKELRSRWSEFMRQGTVFTRHKLVETASTKPNSTNNTNESTGKTEFVTEQVRVWCVGPVIAWCAADGAANRSLLRHRIHALQITEMFQGLGSGTNASPYSPGVKEKLCFCIKTATNTLALEAPEEEIRQLWWVELKRLMEHVRAVVDAHQALPSTADEKWQASVDAQGIKADASTSALPAIVHEDIDGDTRVEVDDQRFLPLPDVATNFFPYDDIPTDNMLAYIHKNRAIISGVAEAMSRASAHRFADALAKERAQDARARAQWLQTQRQLSAKNKHYIPPTYTPPNTASQAWFQTIRDFKRGLRVSTVSAEQSKQALGNTVTQAEFTSISALETYAPVNSDLRQIPQLAPSVQFEECAPTIFARLRAFWGIPLSLYVNDVGAEEFFVRVLVQGDKKQSPASHKVAWYSSNSHFRIESVTAKEAKYLLSWLHLYYAHMTDVQGDSLLPRYMGLYKMTSREHPQGRYFLVSRNMFSGTLNLLCRYELTGAQPFDVATDEEKLDFIPIFRDQDIFTRHQHIMVRPHQLKTLIVQLRRDIQLLAKVNAYGYRISLALHDLDVTPPNRADILKLSQRYGLDRGERELVAMEHYVAVMSPEDVTLRSELMESLPAVEVYAPDVSTKGSLWTLQDGALCSGRWQSLHRMMMPANHMYYIQFNNILQEFDSKMAWELWWKRKEPGVDFVDPARYAIKLATFVESRCGCDHPDFKLKQKKARSGSVSSAAPSRDPSQERSAAQGRSMGGRDEPSRTGSVDGDESGYRDNEYTEDYSEQSLSRPPRSGHTSALGRSPAMAPNAAPPPSQRSLRSTATAPAPALDRFQTLNYDEYEESGAFEDDEMSHLV